MGIFSRRPDPYGSRAPYGDRVPPELERRRATARDGGGGRGGFPGGGRMLVALVVLAIPLVTFLQNCQVNPITGRRQSISITQEQEIAIGLQAAPEMIQQHRGLDPDARIRGIVQDIGEQLVRANGLDSPAYRWQFHALADTQVVNAFALPGGQVFITRALIAALAEDGNPEPRIAGVLGHEIGHVVGRHGAERISKDQLLQGIVGGVVVATSDGSAADMNSKAMMASLASKWMQMSWGRDQELESDRLGVGFMIEAGYHPEALIDVMNTLDRTASKGRPPEFMSTHPSGEHRREEIRNAIEKWVAKNGPLPTDLKR